MARIVAVHGIGQQRKGAHTLHKDWHPALNDGLARAGHPPIDAADFACAFYGDLFRPAGSMAIGDPPYDATDVEDAFEQTLLAEWSLEAAKAEAALAPDNARAMAATPRAIQAALDALSRSPFFAGLAERLLVFDLKQVSLYLNDMGARLAARARVEQAVSADTRVVVAHSLGSVVAYETLCRHPEWRIEAFVTLGSPLGIRNLIFERLQPAPANGLGLRPDCARTWTNIADDGDVVALVKQLGGCFDAVMDLRVSNGATAHDVAPYLTARETGAAIAAGLA
jgi:hypothetical protein